MELNLSLNSLNKCYFAGDLIQGQILIINKSKSDLKYKLSIKVVGYYLFNNIKENPPKKKAVQFYKKILTLLPNGYSSIGANNQYHFKFPLTSESAQDNYPFLYESYKGATVNVMYEIYGEADANGKVFVSNKRPIIVMVPGQGINSKFGRKRVSYQFSLNPSKIENIQIDKNKVPNFNIEVYLENINACIDKPFNGFINIKDCSVDIKSIELQFLRNEKVLYPEFKGISEVSEIQNLQIGDGDVVRNLEIPVFMIFPRNFCCANLDTKDAQICFEMNLIIVLVNGAIIMENYPINLWRGG